MQFTAKLTTGARLADVNHDLFFQLLYNLINNAIRYNKEGGSIIVSDSYDVAGAYKLVIKDTGIGIKEEELTNIFNRFRKSKGGHTEGYGLGLSIVKSIIVFHGFDIHVESRFGKGSVFTILIPRERVCKE